MPSFTRIAAIVTKELAELRRNRSALAPVVLISALAIALPFFITVVVPAIFGEPLAGDSDFNALARQGALPEGLDDDEARVQVFLFQRFLLLQILVPVTGAMAFAAYSLIGEKQGRTLEPLLATPITTAELLVAKTIGAMVPSLAIMLAGVAIYFGGIAMLARPDVVQHVLNLRSVLLVLVVAPLSGLVSLQVAVLISSRVNDARTAQQFGGLLVLPLTGLFLVMFTGALALTVHLIVQLAAVLFVTWLVLLAVSIRLFDREAILTRWK